MRVPPRLWWTYFPSFTIRRQRQKQENLCQFEGNLVYIGKFQASQGYM